MIDSANPPDESGDRANILIVDDRPDKLLVYRTVLEELQQNLYTAASGDDALRQVLEHDFALILLDVNMPGLDGLETAALIRGRKKSAHTPIILVTADYGDELRMTKAYSLGAVDYIASPVVPEILRAKVKVFVELYLLAEQAKRQAQERIALVEEKAAREAAERASRRLAFLAEASATLASSLDLEATLRELARLAVPRFADVSIVSLLAADGQAKRHEMAWRTGEAEVPLLNASLTELGEAPLDELVGLVQSSGKPETIERDPGDAASRIALPRGLSAHALMLVPLVVRGRRLGVLTLGLEAAARSFETDTHAMVAELASRGATALDNALLFRKIQDEDQRKNEFLAMLAHELRNPLAPISNAVHILRVSDGEADKLAWARELIARQLKQLVRLVDDLLDVSRITRGKIELKIESVDVAQVIHEAIETSRPSIDAQRHTLSLQLPNEPLQVRGDYARVAQILSNLLNNAAKYTPRGGRVSLSATHEDGDAVFRVRDSGVGIPREFLSSIFDPFTQVDRSLARSHGGLGIGLTLVRRLVEMQNGSVTVRSEGRNRGSEFTVRLPVAPASDFAKAAADTAAAQPVLSPAGLRVLVVDDNRDVADSTASVMRMNGCDVHVAYDGKAALEFVQRLRPDAVLLDIGLPTIDGYLVAEHIRAQPENRRTMIVAVSGYGQEQDRERSKSVGFDYHVVKPIDPTVLAGLVGSLRHSREARDGVATQEPLSQGAR